MDLPPRVARGGRSLVAVAVLVAVRVDFGFDAVAVAVVVFLSRASLACK